MSLLITGFKQTRSTRNIKFDQASHIILRQLFSGKKGLLFTSRSILLQSPLFDPFFSSIRRQIHLTRIAKLSSHQQTLSSLALLSESNSNSGVDDINQLDVTNSLTEIESPFLLEFETKIPPPEWLIPVSTKELLLLNGKFRFDVKKEFFQGTISDPFSFKYPQEYAWIGKKWVQMGRLRDFLTECVGANNYVGGYLAMARVIEKRQFLNLDPNLLNGFLSMMHRYEPHLATYPKKKMMRLVVNALWHKVGRLRNSPFLLNNLFPIVFEHFNDQTNTIFIEYMILLHVKDDFSDFLLKKLIDFLPPGSNYSLTQLEVLFETLFDPTLPQFSTPRERALSIFKNNFDLISIIELIKKFPPETIGKSNYLALIRLILEYEDVSLYSYKSELKEFAQLLTAAPILPDTLNSIRFNYRQIVPLLHQHSSYLESDVSCSLFYNMLESNLPPSIHFYTFMIRNSTLTHDFQLSKSIYESLLKEYKCALSDFSKNSKGGLLPAPLEALSPVPFTAMLQSAGETGDLGAFLDVYEDMRNLSINFDDVAYLIIIKHLRLRHRPRAITDLYNFLGTTDYELSPLLMATFLDAFGRFHRTSHIFDSLCVRAEKEEKLLTRECLTVVLSHFVRLGKYKKGLSLFRELLPTIKEKNLITNHMASVIIKAGLKYDRDVDALIEMYGAFPEFFSQFSFNEHNFTILLSYLIRIYYRPSGEPDSKFNWEFYIQHFYEAKKNQEENDHSLDLDLDVKFHQKVLIQLESIATKLVEMENSRSIDPRTRMTLIKFYLTFPLVQTAFDSVGLNFKLRQT